METINPSIEKHYLKEDLYENLVTRFVQQGIPLDAVTRSNLAGADEIHVRGASVSKEMANYIPLKGAKVLDVGCGIGGPCRMLADEYECEATGIDLSHEYVRTATKLSKLVKLDNKTNFIQGDASNLPFNDTSFDVVWTQHVQMNIPDKEKFYSEIFRMLKPGGHFLYYDIFKNGTGTVTYPMPWASHVGQSFLIKSKEMEQLLNNLGFIETLTIDQTDAGIDFFDALVPKLKESGLPKIGLNVLMGESTRPKLSNLLTHMKQGILTLQSGAYKK